MNTRKTPKLVKAGKNFANPMVLRRLMKWCLNLQIQVNAFVKFTMVRQPHGVFKIDETKLYFWNSMTKCVG